MHFRYIFTDNHTPISFSEIQERSEIASYFESNVLINQVLSNTEMLSSTTQMLLERRQPDNLDRLLQEAPTPEHLSP